MTNKIILMGYMGCGKSTVARVLEQRLSIKKIDLDQEIERSAGLSITEIFRLKGEIYFRRLEQKILQEQLTRPDHSILSLGGGTPCYGNNLELLLDSDGQTFYLKASADMLIKRLTNDSTVRPLLDQQKPEELQEYINKHLFERSYFYNQANFIINTDSKTPDEIASQIIEILT